MVTNISGTAVGVSVVAGAVMSIASPRMSKVVVTPPGGVTSLMGLLQVEPLGHGFWRQLGL